MFSFKHKNEVMENSINYSAESNADFAVIENQESDFNTQSLNLPGPGDEDEEEGAEESQEAGNDDDNPPVDPDIVHSPVPPQTGGKPKSE